MFEQVPSKKPYSKDPTGHRQVHDYSHMLQLLNHLLTTAPSWSNRSHRVGVVGLPINAILTWPMGTISGFAVFLDPKVNNMLKMILNVWAQYLKSPASAEVLNTGPTSWFGATGVKDLTATANVGASSFIHFRRVVFVRSLSGTLRFQILGRLLHSRFQRGCTSCCSSRSSGHHCKHVRVKTLQDRVRRQIS